MMPRPTPADNSSRQSGKRAGCSQSGFPRTRVQGSDHVMTGMPDRHRALMTLLAARSALSYEHISATLAIPVGTSD
jgi:DNA-directed RNA polymerase specialized sigma24 family protein